MKDWCSTCRTTKSDMFLRKYSHMLDHARTHARAHTHTRSRCKHARAHTQGIWLSRWRAAVRTPWF